MGDGFTLTQYLMAGGRGFTLHFVVPPEAVRANGVTVHAQPIRLILANIDGADPQSGYLGYLNFDARARDGSRYQLRNITLACGEGPRLSVTFGGPDRHERAGPSGFESLFYQQGYATSACVEEIAKSGHFRLTFAQTPTAVPDVVIETSLPLEAKLQIARRYARDELERAARGDCRIMPAPPDPF